MRKLLPGLILGATTLAFVELPSASMLTTLFARDNAGNPGGAVYFDLQVGPNDLLITGLDTNTFRNAGSTAGFQVFSKLGTGEGFEANAGAWTLETNATITPSGLNDRSPVTFDMSFQLDANTLYGITLVMPGTVNHDYTNGSGSSPFGNGANQLYSNGDLTLLAGSATHTPFGGSLVFDPRVWNGTIYYDVVSGVPEPTTLALLGFGLAGFGVARRRSKTAV